MKNKRKSKSLGESESKSQSCTFMNRKIMENLPTICISRNNPRKYILILMGWYVCVCVFIFYLIPQLTESNQIAVRRLNCLDFDYLITQNNDFLFPVCFEAALNHLRYFIFMFFFWVFFDLSMSQIDFDSYNPSKMLNSAVVFVTVEIA